MWVVLSKRMPLHPPSGAELQLPDFNALIAPTAAIREYMCSFYHLHMPKYFYHLSFFWIPFITIIFLLGFATLLRRIHLGQLWIVRFQTAPNGQTFFAPHTINAFVIFNMFYAVGNVGLLIHLLLMFRFDFDPSWVPYWLAFLWLAVATAGWYSAWGVFYTSPAIFSLRQGSRPFRDLRWWIPSPLLSNVIMFAGPVLLMVLIVGVSIPWIRNYEESIDMWRRWDKAIATQADDTIVSTEQLAQALATRVNFERAMWWAAITYLVWCLFSWLFGLFYFITGLGLIRTVLNQIKVQETLGTELAWSQERAFVGGVRPQWTTENIAVDEEGRVRREGITTERRGRDTRTDMMTEAELNQKRQAAMLARERLDDEAAAVAKSQFFPSIRVDVATRQELALRSYDTKVRLLQKALHNLVWLWSGVIVAIIILAACTMAASALTVKTSIEGSGPYSTLFFALVSTVQWLNSICGIIIFVLITTQAFEPVIEGLRRSHGSDDDLEATTRPSQSSAALSRYLPFAVRRLWRRHVKSSASQSKGLVSSFSATKLTTFFETRTRPEQSQGGPQSPEPPLPRRNSGISEDAGPFSFAERLRQQSANAEIEDAVCTIGFAASTGAHELENIHEECESGHAHSEDTEKPHCDGGEQPHCYDNCQQQQNLAQVRRHRSRQQPQHPPQRQVSQHSLRRKPVHINRSLS